MRITAIVSIRIIIAFVFCGLCSTTFAQATFRLRNGFVLRGKASQIVSLDGNAFASAAANSDPTGLPITVIDDGLKRTFLHQRGMIADIDESPDLLLRIPLWQQKARSSKEIAAVSSQTYAEPFNRYGRRWVTTTSPDGQLRILQGITEINARYVQIEGLQTEIDYVWDMRQSTSAIPAETFELIFEKAIDRRDLDGRLDVVNFYIESERFLEARKALQEVIRDFPEADELPKQFQALTQRQARQILDEAIVRRDAGQYVLAMNMLQRFIIIDGVARITKLEAQDRIKEFTDQVEAANGMLQQLSDQIAQLPVEQQVGLLEFVERMNNEMTPDTLPRLSDYQRLGSEQGIAMENRIALGIGGWILGAGSGLQNLAVAKSLIEVRELVFEYLSSADSLRRSQIVTRLQAIEGASPENVARILKLLPPPLPLPERPDADPAGRWLGPPATPADPQSAGEADGAETMETDQPLEDEIAEADQGGLAEPDPTTDPPGHYQLTIESNGEQIEYSIQLPPEYHPLRKYPTIVALHPLQASREAEILWWAGPYSAELGMRAGQASRRGYIVIAPTWSRPGQPQYEFTPGEHHRVLATLRDAMRRVSIDTERVFLAGHMAGGTAAWDIALAHPDPWAGLISIGGDAGKYILHYAENARYIPMYFVTGEIAGSPAPLSRNGAVYDKYMKFSYDAMIVLYTGRGDETFYEDINNIFDWMGLSSHRRNPPPKEIEVATMREGDQFFWWLELPQILDNVAINPILFDHEKRKLGVPVKAKIGEANVILITQAPSKSFNVLFSPEMGLDMQTPITVRAAGRSKKFEFDGSVEFMLEDARRRADRQHVYWAQMSVP